MCRIRSDAVLTVNSLIVTGRLVLWSHTISIDTITANSLAGNITFYSNSSTAVSPATLIVTNSIANTGAGMRFAGSLSSEGGPIDLNTMPVWRWQIPPSLHAGRRVVVDASLRIEGAAGLNVSLPALTFTAPVSISPPGVEIIANECDFGATPPELLPVSMFNLSMSGSLQCTHTYLRAANSVYRLQLLTESSATTVVLGTVHGPSSSLLLLEANPIAVMAGESTYVEFRMDLMSVAFVHPSSTLPFGTSSAFRWVLPESGAIPSTGDVTIGSHTHVTGYGSIGSSLTGINTIYINSTATLQSAFQVNIRTTTGGCVGQGPATDESGAPAIALIRIDHAELDCAPFGMGVRTPMRVEIDHGTYRARGIGNNPHDIEIVSVDPAAPGAFLYTGSVIGGGNNGRFILRGVWTWTATGQNDRDIVFDDASVSFSAGSALQSPSFTFNNSQIAMGSDISLVSAGLCTCSAGKCAIITSGYERC